MSTQRARVAALILLLRCLEAQALKNEIDCVVNTGLSCESGPCPVWQGPAVKCNKGKCLCGDGTCSSENKVCYEMPYIPIGNGSQYKLRSARWPEWFLYGGKPGEIIKVIPQNEINELKAEDMDRLMWTLSLPGRSIGADSESDDKTRIFFLTSAAFPDSTVSVSETWAKVSARVVPVQDPGSSDVGPSMESIGVRIFLAPVDGFENDPDPPLMIMNQNKVMQCDFTSREMIPSKSDVGPAGYWFFEPPLPEEIIREHITPYTGRKCPKFVCSGTVKRVAGADGARCLSCSSATVLAFLAALVSLH